MILFWLELRSIEAFRGEHLVLPRCGCVNHFVKGVDWMPRVCCVHHVKSFRRSLVSGEDTVMILGCGIQSSWIHVKGENIP